MTVLYWVVDCLATLVECIGCCAFTGIFVEKKNVKKRILVDSTFFSIFIIMMNRISLFSSCNTTLGLTKKSIIDFHFLSTFFAGSLCLIHIYTINQFNQHRTV